MIANKSGKDSLQDRKMGRQWGREENAGPTVALKCSLENIKQM